MTQPTGYAALVADAAPALLRLAVMLTGRREDGEDLLQSPLLRAERHGERIATMDEPNAYLRTVVVHEHASRGRRSSRRLREIAAVDALDLAMASDDEAVVLRDQTWRWLKTLRAKQRAMLVLRYYEDLADTEIASILGCPESTVRSHARRGLTALRAHLTDQSEEDR